MQLEGNIEPRLTPLECSIIARCILYAKEENYFSGGAYTDDGCNKSIGGTLEEVFTVVNHYWCGITFLFRPSDRRAAQGEVLGTLHLMPGRGLDIILDYGGPDEFCGAIDRVVLEDFNAYRSPPQADSTS